PLRLLLPPQAPARRAARYRPRPTRTPRRRRARATASATTTATRSRARRTESPPKRARATESAETEPPGTANIAIPTQSLGTGGGGLPPSTPLAAIVPAGRLGGRGLDLAAR